MNATFCDADVLLSDVAGLIERSAGIDDPAFRELLRQTTRALLPRRRERNRGLILPS